jgi:hypothetical protein
MTRDEHMLIILLLMKQNQSIKILIEALKSRGVWTEDDAQAFEFSQMQDAASNAALFDELRKNYVTLANSLGVQTGLEDMPELPLDWFRPRPPKQP